MVTDIPLIILPNRLAICRLPAEAPLPDWIQPGDIVSIVRTREELSVVCEERYVPPEVKAERGWRAIKVQGPLDFALIGLFASLAIPLSDAGISLFAISTYDTDYILIRENKLGRAVEVLGLEGFPIQGPIASMDAPTS